MRQVHSLDGLLVCALGWCLIGACPRLVHANQRGEQILATMDQAFTQAESQSFVFDLITKEPGKELRKLTFEVTIKGSMHRIIRFLEPGDIKGMSILIQSLTNMYVYLPAYQKVRRVAGHVKDQGFMGSTYSYDEMGMATYGGTFTADFVSENQASWTISCTRRPGKESEVRFATIEFDVRKDINQPSEVRYFNEQGVKLKTETRTDYDCRGTLCNPKLMKLVDHTRNGAESMMVRKAWNPNANASDELFTVRDLQRPR